MLRADRGILAHDEEALHPAVEHAQHGREMRVVARDPRDAREAVAVFLGRPLAEPGLEQRHDVVGEGRPPASVGAAAGDVALEIELLLRRVRHVQVAGEQVVERRDVGRALDRRVAAQREDPAPGTADVPEQQLEDGRRADHLRARGVLRPSHRVAEGRRALAAGVLDQISRHSRKSASDMPQILSTISGV